MSRDEHCERLQAFLRDEIPLARAMQASVDAWDGRMLTVSAPLAPNTNHRGTAFGGSLYSLAVLAAWGLVKIRLWLAETPCDVVLRSAEASYTKPVTGRLEARCRMEDQDQWARLSADIAKNGKGRLVVSAVIGQPGDEAFSLQALFVVFRPGQVASGSAIA